MYKNTEEAVGELFLSGYWDQVKRCDVLIVAQVMWSDELTVERAAQNFPEQFKESEE